jgi:hypothetical protein
MADQQKINSASRLATLLEYACNQTGDNIRQLNVWAAVLGLHNLSGRNQKLAIARGIDLMYRELDHMVDQLRNLGFDEESYRPVVTSFEQNISVEYLAQLWRDFRARLQPTLYPLKILKNALPDEENSIDPAEWQKISEELNRLEESLHNAQLSPELMGFIKKQIEIIRQAIRDYPIRGAVVFYDAWFEGAREAYANDEFVKQNEDSESLKTLGKVWQHVKQITATAVKVSSFLAASQRIYQLAETSSHFFRHLK